MKLVFLVLFLDLIILSKSLSLNKTTVSKILIESNKQKDNSSQTSSNILNSIIKIDISFSLSFKIDSNSIVEVEKVKKTDFIIENSSTSTSSNRALTASSPTLTILTTTITTTTTSITSTKTTTTSITSTKTTTTSTTSTSTTTTSTTTTSTTSTSTTSTSSTSTSTTITSTTSTSTTSTSTTSTSSTSTSNILNIEKSILIETTTDKEKLLNNEVIPASSLYLILILAIIPLVNFFSLVFYFKLFNKSK
jgi:hypothetical protein